MPPSTSKCDPGANRFIERFFGDCIFDDRDMLGFVAGMLSIACWMGAQVRRAEEEKKKGFYDGTVGGRTSPLNCHLNTSTSPPPPLKKKNRCPKSSATTARSPPRR